MFGTDDNQTQPQDDTAALPVTPAPEPTTDATSGVPDFVPPDNMPAFDPTLPKDTTAADQPASAPVVADDPLPAIVDDTTSSDTSDTTPTTPTSDNASDNSGNNDLLSIKQDALQQLSPLVGQLDLSPEDKFKTTMMMIQASDDQSLVQAAYDAAKAIPDEKVRAQALLDVVNEINYFTQHHQN